MNDAGTDMVGDDSGDTPNPFLPAPEDLQHWASVMARAQQMMLDHALGQVEAGQGAASLFDPARWLDSDGARPWAEQDRKSDVSGTGGAERVDSGVGRSLKK